MKDQKTGQIMRAVLATASGTTEADWREVWASIDAGQVTA